MRFFQPYEHFLPSFLRQSMATSTTPALSSSAPIELKYEDRIFRQRGNCFWHLPHSLASPARPSRPLFHRLFFSQLRKFPLPEILVAKHAERGISRNLEQNPRPINGDRVNPTSTLLAEGKSGWCEWVRNRLGH